MSCAGNLDRFLCRKRVLTQHIGFSLTRSTGFLTRHVRGKWVLTPPLRSQTSQTFCESAGNMLTQRALYNDRASRVTTCRSMRSFPQWHGLKQARFPPRPRKTAWRSDITNIIWPHGVPQTRHDSAPPSLMDTAKSPRTSPLWTCFVLAYMRRLVYFRASVGKFFGFGSHVGYYSLTRMRLTRCLLRGAYARLTRNVP